MSQDQIFLDREGDAWFRRNQEVLAEADRVDWPLILLRQLRTEFKPKSAIELGCSNGWRLERLRDTIPRLVGIDASAEAIADGKRRFPTLDLRQGLLSELPVAETFDLAIVNYVLHWVDRAQLSRSIAEIDRTLADDGILILGDFLPDHPVRRRYHHLPDADVWTWKQNYGAIFESLGTYRQIACITYDHDRPEATLGASDGRSRGACFVLQKRLRAYYGDAA